MFRCEKEEDGVRAVEICLSLWPTSKEDFTAATMLHWFINLAVSLQYIQDMAKRFIEKDRVSLSCNTLCIMFTICSSLITNRESAPVRSCGLLAVEEYTRNINILQFSNEVTVKLKE
jgi:hypothetical protein